MLYYTVIPRPSIGDVFVRYSDNGDYEEASVLSIRTRTGSDWRAVVICANGFDFITGVAERRGYETWFPKGWVFDNATESFRPPNTKWNPETAVFEPADLGEAEKVASGPGHPTKDAKPPGAQIANVITPEPAEHYMSWFARLRRHNPEVDFNADAVKTSVTRIWESRATAE